jgi:hypothetical protein
MPLKNSPLAVLGFLYHLVGPRAVLLPIAFGRELPNWPNWQKTTLRESTESAFQHRLLRAIEAGGNISALLGPTGGNVCVIEITFAEQLEIFLSLNPWTRETFWTKDAHGCQIWTRITGDYHPTRINSKTQNKRHPIAKWRGGGGDQCLLYGEDPNGRRIQRIAPQLAKLVTFSNIVWPRDWQILFGEESAEGRRAD